MKFVYLELESHTDIVDLDWARFNLTFRTSIVIHIEPKNKFDPSVVTANTFLDVLFYTFDSFIVVMIWWYNTLFSSILQYTEILSWNHGIFVIIQVTSTINNLLWHWWILCFWNDVVLPWMHLLHWKFVGIANTDIQNIKPYYN